ncbi:MAG: CPBP family intramembrane metalloprotease [Alphaproteobacteria bacterium]|nr:CPBP family intramembrane metalloprotease [Alphaproteobacteria bacterium]MBV9693191.1 CPBP family intramembrane metalloprotease [Alphaproteobacteria bacterium]
MSTDGAPGATHFRFRFVPVLTAVLLGFGLPYLAGEIVEELRHYTHLVPAFADKTGWSSATHAVLLVLTLIAIAAMRWLVPADYGLHPPRDKSYLVWAVVWGVGGGIVLGALQYLGDLSSQEIYRTHADALASAKSLGALLNYGVFVGPAQEVLFRALLVTFLAAKMPGTWSIGGRPIEAAGVTVGLIYALFEMTIFPSALATIGYVLCLVVMGTVYAYWQLRSRSVVAPIVGHSLAGMVMYVVSVGLTLA